MKMQKCKYCGVVDKEICQSIADTNTCNTYLSVKSESEDFDFGFTFGESEEEIAEIHNTELERFKEKVVKLHNSILPFLDNLAKNPDKPIVWPNRVQKIEEFKEKLKNIVEE